MQVWESIRRWAEESPDRLSISPLSYSELRDLVVRCHDALPEVKGKRVGLFIGNRPMWGIYDIALTLKGAVVVPIPTFFTPNQIRHIVEDSSMELAVIESAEFSTSSSMDGIFSSMPVFKADAGLEVPSMPLDCAPLEDIHAPDRIAKIIYTSGTTGKPKGVMARLDAMEAVTASLAERTCSGPDDRHLSLLPLSTLVEAIGGLYLPLTGGGATMYPGVKEAENILFNPAGLRKALIDAQPTMLNLVPSLLEAMLKGARGSSELPSSLRFVACGGAPLLPSVQEKAKSLGLPLYQGYGLSECTSVVAVNGPGLSRPGSVGKVLSHADVHIAEDGEIIVSGKGLMSGYTDGTKKGLKNLPTGDLGYIDDEGYLYITGRKDNLIITNKGRNVSPEWVESVLYKNTNVRQVMVYGDSSSRVAAIVVPDSKWLEAVCPDGKVGVEAEKEMMAEIDGTSEELPLYARVEVICLANEAFSVENGLKGADGRLKRKEILKAYDRRN